MLCAICGVNVATTSDHVPPKNLFAPPRPALITVPSCFACNNSASSDDEELMIYVSLQIGMGDERTRILWKSNAMRALNRNKRFQRDIVAKMREVPVKATVGQEVETRTAFLAKAEVYKSVFERTVRGLFYHHFGEILGGDVSIEVCPLTDLSPEAYEITNVFPQNQIGGNALIYKYARIVGEPKASLWVFQLYERQWIMVITELTSA